MSLTSVEEWAGRRQEVYRSGWSRLGFFADLLRLAEECRRRSSFIYMTISLASICGASPVLAAREEKILPRFLIPSRIVDFGLLLGSLSDLSDIAPCCLCSRR